MIYTKKKYLHRYLGRHDGLDTAIRHILQADLSLLVPGRNEIDGDQVFVNRFGYETMAQEQAQWEGHIQYADLHVLLSGQEKIGVSCADDLEKTQTLAQEDFVGYQGPVETWFSMTPEDVLIVFPEDVHMVKVANGASTRVEKACYKVKV